MCFHAFSCSIHACAISCDIFELVREIDFISKKSFFFSRCVSVSRAEVMFLVTDVWKAALLSMSSRQGCQNPNRLMSGPKRFQLGGGPADERDA